MDLLFPYPSLVRSCASRSVTGDRAPRETRLYLTSAQLPAEQLGAIVRHHWAIENSLHWVMDMVFRDDECRVRTEHAPANFTRSEEHTSELQSLMRISYAVFCLKKKQTNLTY